jgi:hypothetical protein
MIKKIIDFAKKKIIIHKYKKKNKNIFNNHYRNSKSQVLVEFNAFHSDHVFLSYLSNYLAQKYKSKIVGFHNFSLMVTKLKYSLIKSIKWDVGKFIKYKNFGIYNSFGVQKFIRPILSSSQNIRAEKIYLKSLRKIKSKKDIYLLKFNKIPLGDLIYDNYLKTYFVPTVDFNSNRFRTFFLDFIKLIIYWNDYFKKNNVKAVIGVHAQYSYGIIHRTAVFKNIKTILHHEGRVYRLTKKNYFQLNEFRFFKKEFKKLPKKIKLRALKKGQQLIDNRLGGALGIKSGDTTISKSSFDDNYKKKVLIKKNNKLNILITTQDFFDSINVYGKFFFNDYYEWLEFLGEMSKKTKFNWYIKDHPNYAGKFKRYQPFTAKVTDNLCKKYPNFTRISSNISHKQIISEGIDYTLTVYGSVQFEYPYFNVPVLTASRATPSIDYDFCIHSKNFKDYKNKILNLKKVKKKIDIKSMQEFYFMNFAFNNRNNVYPLYGEFNIKYKKWDLYWSETFYQFWLDNFNTNQHSNMMQTIENFINSKDYAANITHSYDKYKF